VTLSGLVPGMGDRKGDVLETGGILDLHQVRRTEIIAACI
jgi:hypothetical protein